MRKANSTNVYNEKALQQYCKASKTLALFSGRWKFSILFQLLEEQTMYTQFKTLLPAISDRTLSRQLSELIHDGLIVKEKDKTSSVYSIAEKGLLLKPLLHLLVDLPLGD